MATKFSKNQVLTSLFWKFLEKGGTQLLQFIVQVVLARLLLPKDFGLISLVLVFTTIASVFVESGFSTALIQKREADELDFSSVFFLSFFVACVLYIIIFFLAPWISRFYSMPQLTAVLRILSIILLFGAVNSVQNAIVAKELQFKLLFFRSTIAFLISGFIGISMAYIGFGVWSLVAQQVCYRFLVTLILWLKLKWRPRFMFSITRLRALFVFGWKLLASYLIDNLYGEARNLIIGKLYSSSTLGYFTRGQAFPAFVVSSIDGSIQSVMLPVFSSHQEDQERIKSIVRRSITTGALLSFPMMSGLASVADSLVLVLMTEKWLPAVPFVRIFCILYAFYPIHSPSLQAINGLGFSGTFLRLNLIKSIGGLVILFLTVPLGIYVIALGQAINVLISSFINAVPIRRILGYKFKEQFADIYPPLLLSIAMGAFVSIIKWFDLTPVVTLAVQVVVGVVFYVGAAWLFKLKSVSYIMSSLRNFFKR